MSFPEYCWWWLSIFGILLLFILNLILLNSESEICETSFVRTFWYLFYEWGWNISVNVFCALEMHVYSVIPRCPAVQIPVTSNWLTMWTNQSEFFTTGTLTQRTIKCILACVKRMHVHVSMPWRSEDSCRSQSAFTVWVQRPNSSVRSGDKCLSLLSHLTDSV